MSASDELARTAKKANAEAKYGSQGHDENVVGASKTEQTRRDHAKHPTENGPKHNNTNFGNETVARLLPKIHLSPLRKYASLAAASGKATPLTSERDHRPCG